MSTILNHFKDPDARIEFFSNWVDAKSGKLILAKQGNRDILGIGKDFNKNEPGMVSKFTTILGEAKLNIAGMINQNRGDIAYNIIDVDGVVQNETVESLAAIEGVTKVRPIYA
jgi:hypothetical protein